MARAAKEKYTLAIFAVGLFVIVTVITFIAEKLRDLEVLIVDNKVPILVMVAIILSIVSLYYIYQSWYFKSKQFNSLKNSIIDYINNCNELNLYARTPFGHPAHRHLASVRMNTWPAHASFIWPPFHLHARIS
ncbi:hypothetical protein JHD50_05790 [Sulfurimonas sp. MAG313]|nr:hypothetical protein [Sulfurimonas sp. MAG313]MDF1880820.1 hypothetical protein [Sulfurimonas sp. MAG313]